MTIKEYNQLQCNIIKKYQLESLITTDIKEFNNICQLISLFRKYTCDMLTVDAVDMIVEEELKYYKKYENIC